jgi:hypothetical protein
MNPHNRYCKKCYTRTVYLHHINNIPWFTCEYCDRIFHLHETIGEPRFYRSIDVVRDKRIKQILTKIK